MFISILIPTYRRADILSELLTALAHQLPKTGVEVLVIDNDPDASARDLVERQTGPLRYIHEPTSGVVHARNRGLAEAQGDYILFIDDDEVPAKGWLAAFTAQAEAGVTAAFGRIIARYATPPKPELQEMLDHMFARDAVADAGGDVTSEYARLGCGNAMFHKAKCFPTASPFEERFNRLGGEDAWLIKGLVDKGAKLVWVPDGLVEEVVPADRQTLAYLKLRRFNQGRLRSVINMQRSKLSGAKWMVVGAVQMKLYAVLWAGAALIGHQKAASFAVQMQGGAGKLFWWRTPSARLYGG